MDVQLVLPMLFAVSVSFCAGLLQRRLSPAVAAWLLSGLAVVSASSVIWAVGTLGLGWLSEQTLVESWLGWCRPVVSHHGVVPTAVGAPSLVIFAAMLMQGTRVALAHGRSSRAHHLGDSVEFVATDEPFAYALPGRPGQVVVSTGMLCCLKADERTVLFAHEQAHLALHHHRFVAVADTAAAAVPILGRLRRQVRFATERWADESAASEVGNRTTVARALARAAIATTDHTGRAMAFGGHGVMARIEALLTEPAGRPVAELASSACLTALVLAGVAASIQLHHLVQLAFHACGVT